MASGPKLAFIACLGADDLVDYHHQDLAALGERWDVILYSPGRSGFRRMQHLLTPDGVVVSPRPIAADALRALPLRQWRRYLRRWTAVMTSARS